MTIRELYEQAERYGVADRPLQVLVRTLENVEFEAEWSNGCNYCAACDHCGGEATGQVIVTMHDMAGRLERLEPAGLSPSNAVVIVELDDIGVELVA